MRLVLELKFSRIHVEGNCLAVIQTLNYKEVLMSYFGTFIINFKRFLRLCSRSKIFFVRRESNPVVHYLVKFFRYVENFMS